MAGVDLVSLFPDLDYVPDLFIHILFYIVCMLSFFSLGVIFSLYAVGYMAANATREDMEDIYFLKFSDGDFPFYSIKHPTDMFVVFFTFFQLKFRERFFKKKRLSDYSAVKIRRTKVNKRISVTTLSIITIFSLVAVFHFIDTVKAEKARHILKAETTRRQMEIVRNSPKKEQARKLPKTETVHSSSKTETVDSSSEKTIVHNSPETNTPRNFPKKENKENGDNLQEKEIARSSNTGTAPSKTATTTSKTEPVPSKTDSTCSLLKKDPVRTTVRTLLKPLQPITEPIVPMRR